MERYIDVGALGIGRAKRELFTIPEYADGWNDAIRIIENAPTADVVPRAEVEQLKAIIDRLEREKAEMLVSETAEFRIPMEIAYRVRTEHPIVKAIKSEAAREIFADLEQHGICETIFKRCVFITEQEFEELKKKYGVE